MSESKKMNDSELDSVAGGIGDVNMEGSSSGRDTTILDQSATQNIINKTETVFGDKVGGNKSTETVFGDKTGGDKTDVDTRVDANVSVKNSLF